MFSFMLSLLVLTLMFSIISAAALLFRRTFLKGREGVMYPFWIVILIISIIPLRVDFLQLTSPLIGEPAVQAEVYAKEAMASDMSRGIAERPQNTPHDAHDDIARESVPLMKLRRMMAASVEFIDEIATGTFVLWLSGALLSFADAMIKFISTKRVMIVNSAPCRDERISRCVSELREKMGIRRRIRIRMFNVEALSSPCVVGCVKPTLFVESGCITMSDGELCCVLTHELTHLRRFDTVTKLLCIFAASVHWFNPASRHVQTALYEDCELSCDYSVVAAYGTTVSGLYMGAILDFAQRYAEHCRLVCRSGISGGMFLSQSSGVSFLKRRYTNMKNFRKNRAVLCVTAVFTLLCVGANMLAMSSCSGITTSTLGSAIELSPSVDAMVRAYYGLDSDDYITPAMVDAIRSVKVSQNEVTAVYRDEQPEAYQLVEFTVNKEPRFTSALPTVAKTKYYDELISSIYEGAKSHNGNTADCDRFKAFYTFIDITKPELTADECNKLTAMYPNIEKDLFYYVLDSHISERERIVLYGLMGEYGLLNAWTLKSDEFDASSFGYFENLEEIEFVGVTPVGYDFPDHVRVTVTETGPQE